MHKLYQRRIIRMWSLKYRYIYKYIRDIIIIFRKCSRIIAIDQSIVMQIFGISFHTFVYYNNIISYILL